MILCIASVVRVTLHLQTAKGKAIYYSLIIAAIQKEKHIECLIKVYEKRSVSCSLLSSVNAPYGPFPWTNCDCESDVTNCRVLNR